MNEHVAGEDLAAVLDRVAGGYDLRSCGGTWAFVTRGVLTRAGAFETAVLSALAPFYHPQPFVSGPAPPGGSQFEPSAGL